MTMEELEGFLLMASYTSADVARLTGYKSRTSVARVMNVCRKLGGAIPYRPNAITSESFWRYRGSTREKEIAYLKQMKGELCNNS